MAHRDQGERSPTPSDAPLDHPLTAPSAAGFEDNPAPKNKTGRQGELRPGIDYVVDYYAVLGVPRDADEAAIKTAFRDKVKRVNPNKLQGTDYEEDGRRKLEILGLAKDTLIDSEQRAAYDKKLDSFASDLRSKTGAPMLSLSASSAGVDIEQLLGGRTGFNIREVFRQEPESNPEDLADRQEAYRNNPCPKTALALKRELSRSLNDAQLEEMFSWHESGLEAPEDPKVQLRPDALIEDRNSRIEKARESIPQIVESHLLAGSEVARFLLPAADAPTQEVADELVEHSAAIQLRDATSVALSRFDKHAENLRAIAEQRSAITNEIVALTDWHYLGSGEPEFKRLVILMVDKDKGGDVVKMGFDCSLRDGAVDISRIEDFDGLSVNFLESEQFSITCDKLRQDLQADIAVFSHFSAVPFGLELDYVMQQHFQTITSLPL